MQVWEQLQQLRRAMAAHGLQPKLADYLVAELNEVGTLPALRHNDVMVQLEAFALW